MTSVQPPPSANPDPAPTTPPPEASSEDTVDVDGYPIGYLDGGLEADDNAPVNDAEYDE